MMWAQEACQPEVEGPQREWGEKGARLMVPVKKRESRICARGEASSWWLRGLTGVVVCHRDALEYHGAVQSQRSFCLYFTVTDPEPGRRTHLSGGEHPVLSHLYFCIQMNCQSPVLLWCRTCRPPGFVCINNPFSGRARLGGWPWLQPEPLRAWMLLRQGWKSRDTALEDTVLPRVFFASLLPIIQG